MDVAQNVSEAARVKPPDCGGFSGHVAHDVSEAARSLAAARWGDTVLRRSATVVLERAELSDATRAELAEIAEQGEEHG